MVTLLTAEHLSENEGVDLQTADGPLHAFAIPALGRMVLAARSLQPATWFEIKTTNGPLRCIGSPAAHEGVCLLTSPAVRAGETVNAETSRGNIQIVGFDPGWDDLDVPEATQTPPPNVATFAAPAAVEAGLIPPAVVDAAEKTVEQLAKEAADLVLAKLERVAPHVLTPFAKAAKDLAHLAHKLLGV